MHPRAPSGEPLDTGGAVEAGVKAHDPAHAVLLHDRQVNCVAGREVPMAQDDDPRSLDGGAVDGEDFIDEAEERIERRLDGVAAIDGHVAMEDLLQDLGIRDQPLATR
jgi:hypothetical protein